LRPGLSAIKITADDVFKELAKIGFSNIINYMRVGENGDPYVDMSNLSRGLQGAIALVDVDNT
jgi:phage terminase small subunit